MIAKNSDNESGMPSQMLKSTGITSDQEPNTINKSTCYLIKNKYFFNHLPPGSR
jgi:hypothetical protein